MAFRYVLGEAAARSTSHTAFPCPLLGLWVLKDQIDSVHQTTLFEDMREGRYIGHDAQLVRSWGAGSAAEAGVLRVDDGRR